MIMFRTVRVRVKVSVSVNKMGDRKRRLSYIFVRPRRTNNTEPVSLYVLE